MYRAEKIVLTEGIHTETFALADRNTRFAKGLYNAALFRLRQSFTGWDKADRTDNEKEVFAELAKLREAYPSLGVRRVLSYGVLEKLMRVTANPDFFAGLPMQTAQAVVKAAAGDFSNWLASLRAYKKDPSRFLGRPRMPRYCKNDKKSFTVTNQDAVLYPVYKDARGRRIDGRKPTGRNTEDGCVYAGMELKLPGTRNRLYLPHLPEDAALKEVKVCPYYRKYVLILVLEVKDPQKSENTPRIAPHMAGIDLGTVRPGKNGVIHAADIPSAGLVHECDECSRCGDVFATPMARKLAKEKKMDEITAEIEALAAKIDEFNKGVGSKVDGKIEKTEDYAEAAANRIERALTIDKAAQEQRIADLIDYAEGCYAMALTWALEAEYTMMKAAYEIKYYNKRFGEKK